MYDDQPYPLWIQVGALGVILAPTIALIAFRRRIGPMNAACALVVWGALAAGGEHGSWAMRLAIHERSWSEPHATIHYFMAGAYAAIAGVLLGVIALTLFREGRPSGWFVVLFVTLVGGGLELTMNGPTGYLYHHVGLYGYVAAWLAALVIAYTPTFSPSRPIAGSESSATDMEHLWRRGQRRRVRERGHTAGHHCRHQFAEPVGLASTQPADGALPRRASAIRTR